MGVVFTPSHWLRSIFDPQIGIMLEDKKKKIEKRAAAFFSTVSRLFWVRVAVTGRPRVRGWVGSTPVLLLHEESTSQPTQREQPIPAEIDPFDQKVRGVKRSIPRKIQKHSRRPTDHRQIT